MSKKETLKVLKRITADLHGLLISYPNQERTDDFEDEAVLVASKIDEMDIYFRRHIEKYWGGK